MWIIDEESEQVDVTEIHGSVPENILRLYHADREPPDEQRPRPVNPHDKVPPVRAGRFS
jgi:hypothetical protein